MDKNLGLGKYKSDSQVSHWLKQYNHVESGKMWFETIMIMKLVKKVYHRNATRNEFTIPLNISFPTGKQAILM